MIRQALTIFIIGVIYSVLARDCISPGVEPQKCNSDCQLPDCACEESEPDVALAERPQVIFFYKLSRIQCKLIPCHASFYLLK